MAEEPSKTPQGGRRSSSARRRRGRRPKVPASGQAEAGKQVELRRLRTLPETSQKIPASVVRERFDNLFVHTFQTKTEDGDVGLYPPGGNEAQNAQQTVRRTRGGNTSAGRSRLFQRTSRVQARSASPARRRALPETEAERISSPRHATRSKRSDFRGGLESHQATLQVVNPPALKGTPPAFSRTPSRRSGLRSRGKTTNPGKEGLAAQCSTSAIRQATSRTP